MSVAGPSKRRDEELSRSGGRPAKRARQGLGTTRTPQAGRSVPPTTARRKTLTDLPVELLYTVLVVSANSELALVSRRLQAVLQHAPPQIRAAFLVSRLWQHTCNTLVPPSSFSRRQGGSLGLHDAEFVQAFIDLWPAPVAAPPRLIDPRDLLHRQDLSVPPWHEVQYFERGNERRRLPTGVKDPLGFALRFPICSCAVIDAFSAMLHQIPTFREAARMATHNGRLRIKAVPAHVVSRLVPPRASASPANPPNAVGRDAPRAQTSGLYDLVSQLGQGPRPPEPALRLFLRLLFWHLASYVEMPTEPRPPGEPMLEMLRAPLVPIDDDGNGGAAAEDDQGDDMGTEGSDLDAHLPAEDRAILQAADDRNLWALRLVRRFERKRLRSPQPQQSFLPPIFLPENWVQAGGSHSQQNHHAPPRLGTQPLFVQDVGTDRDDADFVASYLVAEGWVEGLRYVVKSETPDEAILESRVCNEIARALFEEGVVGTRREPSGLAELDRRRIMGVDELLLPGPSCTLSHAPTSAPSPGPTPSAPAPAPSHILFARPERVVHPSLLRFAVQQGQFDVVDYLMHEHGLTPDMQTLHALERRRRKRQKEQQEQHQHRTRREGHGLSRPVAAAAAAAAAASSASSSASGRYPWTS
ncbi:hypothetical protein OC842_006437 [Tilletia horrida]|uniref:Uncharacterized protein n=1 Tax=Tilletia horrida TaxID=155126 RepID=A0AAN6JHL1_9BASI|nr:hypothetical protein OC842_006437 [Tilletia horrida]